MIYLSGVTNDREEPALVAAGIGLVVQPGNSYHLRIGRFPWWAADNGCLNPATYKGDDRWLEWLDRLPREGCLFVVAPDVARRPDGSLGGDPVGTWAKFAELGPLVQQMGFPAALAAQDGMETMGNVDEQLEACDCLFIAGSTAWKVGAAAEGLARRARNLGKWVHMGRCNSGKRIERARAMGCCSADGTFLKYRGRRRAGEADDARESRGVGEIGGWLAALQQNPLLPGLGTFEAPALRVHREAHDRSTVAT